MLGNITTKVLANCAKVFFFRGLVHFLVLYISIPQHFGGKNA